MRPALLTCIFLASCTQRPADNVVVINDKSMRTDFEQRMATLLKQEETTSTETLKQQLSRTSCRLDLPTPGRSALTPAQIYQQRLASVVLFGRLHRCGSKSCNKVHANIASGVVIHPDGIVLTNHHIVDTKQTHSLGMGVMTGDGRAFLVDEVLAADEQADIAIVRLKNASGLTAAPVFADEPVGNPATIISHPTGKFFTLTHGVVSRYHEGTGGVCVMNVTADYAKGSSGGPVFNDRGDVIGMVANTYSITYRQVPLAIDGQDKSLTMTGKDRQAAKIDGRPLAIGMNHQMTLKNAVSSREILELIDR